MAIGPQSRSPRRSGSSGARFNPWNQFNPYALQATEPSASIARTRSRRMWTALFTISIRSSPPPWTLRRCPQFARQPALRHPVTLRSARSTLEAVEVQKEDVMNEWSNAKLCDVANLILGLILLASPWIFGFPSGAASQNAVVSGIVIAAISIAALAAFTVWEGWLNLVVGVWVLVSPWVLGFAGTTAMYVHIVIGAIVAVLAALEIWLLYQRPPRHTTAS